MAGVSRESGYLRGPLSRRLCPIRDKSRGGLVQPLPDGSSVSSLLLDGIVQLRCRALMAGEELLRLRDLSRESGLLPYQVLSLLHRWLGQGAEIAMVLRHPVLCLLVPAAGTD